MTRSDMVPLDSHSVPNEMVPVPVGEADDGEREPGTSRGNRSRREPGTGNQVVPRGTIEPHGNAVSRNVRGGSRDPLRAGWCTPKWLAEAVGPFDLDPFSNPRSHVVAAYACSLENGDDGFGDGSPGSFFLDAPSEAMPLYASAATRVWLQPPYERGFVARTISHYASTRWVALLRFDPRTTWFDTVYAMSELVAVIRRDPNGRPFGFEPPPGVVASTNTFPHALFYRHASDVTNAVLRHACAWRK
jgi:hypothetical protein